MKREKPRDKAQKPKEGYLMDANMSQEALDQLAEQMKPYLVPTAEPDEKATMLITRHDIMGFAIYNVTGEPLEYWGPVNAYTIRRLTDSGARILYKGLSRADVSEILYAMGPRSYVRPLDGQLP